MKSLLTKLCCLFLFFTLGNEMAIAQSTGKAGGNVLNFFNTSSKGGQIGHSQAGSWGNFVFNSRWIAIGQPSVPSTTELYGMRIQDRAYVGTFSMNGSQYNKDLEILYGTVPVLSPFPSPAFASPDLNFRSVTTSTSSTLRMKLTNFGTLGINNATPSVFFKLDVVGATRNTSGSWVASDRRYKRDITPLVSISDKLSAVEGVTYNLKKEVVGKTDLRKSSDKLQYGFIAQEIQKVFPELVLEDENGYLAVRYEGLIPVLVEGFKEQNTVIADQENTIAEQKEVNAEQESTINALNSKVENLEKQMQTIISAINEMDSKASLQLTPEFSKETSGTLAQNRPNPFKGMTNIQYQLPDNADSAKLIIVNLEGKQIASYNISNRQGSIDFDGSSLAAGTYFYSLIANGERLAQQKMVIQ